MTEQELGALEELAKAAGPQRWTYQDVDSMAGYRIVDEDGLIVMGHHGPDDSIAPFCAAMNPAKALALVAEVRRLRSAATTLLAHEALADYGSPYWEAVEGLRKALEPSDGVAR